MLKWLGTDGLLVRSPISERTMEYRVLEVCTPNIGVLGAIQNMFLSQRQDGSVWEDAVQVGKRTGASFWYKSREFKVWNEVVAARYGPTITLVALRDETSLIPVFQEITLTHRPSVSFVRSHPQAEIVRRAGEISVQTPEEFAWAIFRKTDATRVADRWVAGNLYIRTDLPMEVQAELIAALAVVGLS